MDMVPLQTMPPLTVAALEMTSGTNTSVPLVQCCLLISNMACPQITNLVVLGSCYFALIIMECFHVFDCFLAHLLVA